MATHKPFRELIPPGSNFEFIGRTRVWVSISLLLIAASIGILFVNQALRGSPLNWSIDFKGGTEIVLAFDKDGRAAEIDPGQVRSALDKAGYSGFSVSGFAWSVDDPATGDVTTVEGLRVTMLEFGAVAKDEQEKISEALQQRLGPSLEDVSWSGDRVFLRSKQPVDFDALREVFSQAGYELREWDETLRKQFATIEEGTGEYKAYVSVRGIDAQLEKLLEQELAVNVDIEQTYGVGAKAGEELRNDGIKAMFYALALIMLYLVFRFDVRYAPGAVVALLHDAIIVVGAYALTWQEFSLTTVAAILTVIGYSVNDTVIIFDRIRENVGRLKDKKFSRIINISINETMGRSILTASTVFLVTLMMNIFGTGLVANFAFAMNIGAVIGTFSSIFIASPLALYIHNHWFTGAGATAKASTRRQPRKEEAIEDDVAEDEPVAEPVADEDDDESEPPDAPPPRPRKKVKKLKKR